MGVLSLWRAGTLRQRLSPEGAVWTAGAPSSAQGTIKQGRVNQVTAESAVEALNVVIGTFMVNTHPATVLFDTGATYSFITQSFVEKHRIPVSCMRTLMVVTTPGGKIHTCSICSRISVIIRGVEFRTELIVIDSVGID
jgi:hypothetical protein